MTTTVTIKLSSKGPDKTAKVTTKSKPYIAPGAKYSSCSTSEFVLLERDAEFSISVFDGQSIEIVEIDQP